MANLSVKLNGLLRQSSLVCRWRFGVKVPSRVIPALWDQTTPVLRDALKEHARPGMKLLEIGTGQAAVLLCWLAAKYPEHQLTLVGSEINPRYVENARTVAKANRADVEIINSDLFSQVQGRFEVIFSNPPYVPRNHPAAPQGSDAALDTTWDGGPQGTDIIDAILEGAHQFLTDDGVVLLGVNEFYVPAETVRQAVLGKGYEIQREVAKNGNLSRVYVLSAAG